jgi:hypothetical protein
MIGEIIAKNSILKNDNKQKLKKNTKIKFKTE